MGQKNRWHRRFEPDKFVVIGAIQRKGNLVARVIEDTDTETFENFVREMVSRRGD